MADNEQLIKIRKIVKQLKLDYADDPNVITIGFGAPKRNGRYIDGIAILFYVRQKMPGNKPVEALGSTVIPDEIDGLPTDVIVQNMVPDAMGQRDERKYDPLLGGPATSNSEQHILWFNGHGTLGILATDNATGSPVALSNWHVWADGADQGDQIIQPGHPTGGDHVEAVGKVLACGPLITSLIEWEAPDPIAGALYGGAAALAVAAALSDVKDPTRRGQDATIPPKDETTLQEHVATEIAYHDLPLPGYPFRTETEFSYGRETENRIMKFDVNERLANAQFLLGKILVTDRPSYSPGQFIGLSAAIWDYQLARSCEDYHVVAHMIPHSDQSRVVRAVLQPTSCDADDFGGGQDEKDNCIFFSKMKIQRVTYKGAFEWLRYLRPDQQEVAIVKWGELGQGMQIPRNGIEFYHPPASKVTAKVVLFANEPVTMTAKNGGTVVDQVISPAVQGEIHELDVNANGISTVRFEGGGHEAVLIDYCVERVKNHNEIAIRLPEDHLKEVLKDAKQAEIKVDAAKAQRCCFSGRVRLPYNEPKGKWDVYLTVQNVNNVPDGTPAEVAATTIGGHMLSAHTPSPAGCTSLMLLDHVFDVI